MSCVKLISLLLIGLIIPLSSQSCNEQPGEGNTVLSQPCTFNEFVSEKGWNVSGLHDDTNNFFSFDTLECNSFAIRDGKVELSCSAGTSFYLMKQFLSYGASTKPTIKFLLSTSSPNSYNSTKITINGQLSEANSFLQINALKESGKTEFGFESQHGGDFNVQSFLDQRKPNIFSKLTQSNRFSTLIPSMINQPQFFGIFSAIFNTSKPNDQSFELVIQYEQTNFYVIQNVPETLTYHIAFYKKNDAEWQNPGQFMNKVSENLNIPDSFSPWVAADKSAFSSSDGDIVIVNNQQLRELAEDYVSESSQALILEGINIYWHVRDTQQIKKKAEQVTTAEEAPLPTENEEETPEPAVPKKKGKKAFKSKKKARKAAVNNNNNNKRSHKHHSSSKSSLKKRSKRTAEASPFEERNLKIALNAIFTEDTDVVTIRSPEYLAGTVEKVYLACMPNLQLELFIEDVIKPLDVVFEKIEIYKESRKFMVYSNVTSKDFELIQNLIPGENFTLTANATISRAGESPPTHWNVGGFGRAVLLEQIIDVNIVNNGGYFVTGSFEITNMYEFWNSSGQIDYLPRNLKETYHNLNNFAIKNLTFKGEIAGESLIINGESLVFAVTKPTQLIEAEKRDGITDQPNELIDKSEIEILLRNDTDEYDLEYFVGNVAKNIQLENVLRLMFKKYVQGYPWIAFSELAILMVNVSTSLGNDFSNAKLQELDLEPGIQMNGQIRRPELTDCEKEKANITFDRTTDGVAGGIIESANLIAGALAAAYNLMMSDKMCLFLHENNLLFNAIKNVNGSVNTTSFELKSKISKTNDWIDLFGNQKVLMKDIQLQITSQKMNDTQNETTSKAKKRTEGTNTTNNIVAEDMKFVIVGQFKIFLDSSSFIRYDGNIAFEDTEGRIKLSLTRSRERVLTQLPFQFDRTRNGYSPLSGDGFRMIYITVTFYVGTVQEHLVRFRREAEMQFDILNTTNLVIKAKRRNKENADDVNQRKNTFLDILKAFGLPGVEQHVYLKGVQAIQNSEMIYTRKEGEFTIEPHGYRFKKGMHFYGEAMVLGKKENYFYITVDEETNSVSGEYDLPYTEIDNNNAESSSGDFILAGTAGPYKTGGRIVFSGSTQAVTVTFEGYLKTVGVETLTSFELAQDGTFAIQFPRDGEEFLLFEEANATLKIEQATPITSLDQLDPMVEIDLSPSLPDIMDACKNRMGKILHEVNTIVYEENFNRFTSKFDSDGKTVKQLMRDINDQLDPLIEQYNTAKDSLDVDCVQQCENQITNIYGYSYRQRFFANDSFHQIASVDCISECEMMKPMSYYSVAGLLNLAVMHQAYGLLDLRKKIMQPLCDNYYDFLFNLSTKYKHKGRLAGRMLGDLHNVYKPIAKTEQNVGENIPMTLQHFKLSKKLKDLNIKAKCVKGFSATFNFFDRPANSTTKKKCCFNGNFADFLSKGLVSSTFSRDNWAKYKERMQAAADYLKILREETETSIEYLKDAASETNNVEKLEALHKQLEELIPSEKYGIDFSTDSKKRSVANKTMRDHEEPDEEYLQAKQHLQKRNEIKKSRQPNHLYLGDKVIYFPNVDAKFNKILKHKGGEYVSRSPLSKRAFLYSSPWAAARRLSVYKNESIDSTHLVENKNKDACKAAQSYMAVVRSLKRHVSSFDKAHTNLHNLEKHLLERKNGLVTLYNRSLHYLSKREAKEAKYWLSEYTRGVNMYQSQIHHKLTDFDNHGMQRWQENTGRTIQRKFGIPSARYIGDLRQAIVVAASRDKIPSKHQSSLSAIKEFEDLISGGGSRTMKEASRIISRHSIDNVARSLKSACVGA